MTSELQMVLILLALLQVKHLFADFFFQTPRMLADRARYVHLGRLQHAGLHAGFSPLSMVIAGVALPLAIAICLAEWVVHFHIDWAKGRHADASGEGPEDAGYWRAFGIDQLLHQLTYVGMLWAVLAFA